MTILVVLLALVITALVWYFTGPPLKFQRKGKAASTLTAAYGMGTAPELDALPTSSLEFQLRSAGWSWKASSFRVITSAAALGLVLVSWAFLPGVPALVLGALTLTIPRALLRDRIKGRGKALDRDLPIAISRLCAGLLAGGAVADVLEEVGRSLEGEKKSGLGVELRLTASDLRSKDRTQSLQDLAARSPSLSLANLAFLLEGYLEVGGGKYTRILVETAAQLQRVLGARNRTRAKAGDAMLSARIIPAVLALVIASLSRDPMVRQSLASLPVQLILGLTIAAMAGGYLIMRSMVAEAV